MGLYEAKIAWSRGDQPFLDKRYSRAHVWSFDGGAVVPGSSAPSSVPLPMSDASAVDPEEAMIASLSSCHMLWFLAFAANAGLVVDTYVDEASGKMGRNEQGRGYIAEVTLNPCTSFTGRVPSQEELDALHHQAHDHCEMAHSVRATITTVATIG
ncbi:OsmC family protein [Brevundimonas sp.]|jgi:organic hydroperoxide reductase OsmC/OhrA|uniref:OsmC family protein n=1 Tax=Brevundimonas sp. TaxID=1871086 RepID=UPI0037BE5DDE